MSVMSPPRPAPAQLEGWCEEGPEAEVEDLTSSMPPLEQLAVDAADLPCREHDGELWFAERPEDVERAKSLCGGCVARESCLEGALARREPWGVWGGQLLVHGAVVARKRPRGRPRKDTTAA